MNQKEIKIGSQVAYTGLGDTRVGIVIKRTKSTLTVKLMFSTIKLSFKENVTCEDLGIRIL